MTQTKNVDIIPEPPAPAAAATGDFQQVVFSGISRRSRRDTEFITAKCCWNVRCGTSRWQFGGVHATGTQFRHTVLGLVAGTRDFSGSYFH